MTWSLPSGGKPEVVHIYKNSVGSAMTEVGVE